MTMQFDFRRASLLLGLTLLRAGCADYLSPPGQAPANAQPRIVGWDENRYFVDAAGERFFPWGFNYTSPKQVGLIDDNLYAAERWQEIARDFAEMKAYSANTVRVHLQYHRFMHDPVTPDASAFKALHRLVDIAENNRLYLIVTGLGAYRKSDSPMWYDSLSTAERWRTQALFWRTLASEVGQRNAVFAFDLMNEPVVGVCPPELEACSWQPGKSMGGYHFVQNISIEEGLPFRETLSAWMAQLTAAIRQVDQTTLVTVGLLSKTPLALFEDDLDFVSAHVYPKFGQLQDSVHYLERSGERRPLVVTETFNMSCSIDELQEVLTAVSDRLHGIIGHYDGRTIEQLSTSAELDDRLRLNFLEYFVANTPAGG
ncbi:MAG: cellulase family glycosylhydrolase [Halioglobus sp.]|nr:cellulase family glycosylhydrolase [Halioglobus sp.]